MKKIEISKPFHLSSEKISRLIKLFVGLFAGGKELDGPYHESECLLDGNQLKHMSFMPQDTLDEIVTLAFRNLMKSSKPFAEAINRIMDVRSKGEVLSHVVILDGKSEYSRQDSHGGKWDSVDWEIRLQRGSKSLFGSELDRFKIYFDTSWIEGRDNSLVDCDIKIGIEDLPDEDCGFLYKTYSQMMTEPGLIYLLMENLYDDCKFYFLESGLVSAKEIEKAESKS